MLPYIFSSADCNSSTKSKRCKGLLWEIQIKKVGPEDVLETYSLFVRL